MHTVLVLSAWLVLGLVIALRGPRPAWERALALLFWPFFLMGELSLAPPAAAVPPTSPSVDPGSLVRLRAALGEGDPAQALVADLGRALAAHQARVDRLEAALAAVGGPSTEDPALDRARARSRALLAQARDAERQALGEALAAIEEAATRLWLLRAGAERGEVEALLAGLAARLRAGAEVEGRFPGIAPGGG